MISSTTNQQIKNIVRLQKQAKARNEQGFFVTEGRKMFEEALANKNVKVKKVYVSESYLKQYVKDKAEYFKECDYEVVSDSVMKEISETMTPQGVLAVIEKASYTLADMVKGDRVRLILLENLRDPGNLGTIIRTSEGVGITGIILSRESADLYNPKVIRSTMGAIYRVPFLYSDDLIKTIRELKKMGIDVFAAHLHASTEYDRISYGNRTAIMIGNEANGLSMEATMEASDRIHIPMEGQVESLNAAIAASVLMYEVYRQERRKR